jgi:hypothetical protein
MRGVKQGRPGALPLDPARSRAPGPIEFRHFWIWRGGHDGPDLGNVPACPPLQIQTPPRLIGSRGSPPGGVQGQSPWPSLMKAPHP